MYIYKIVNILNGKVYVGQTCSSLKKRWYDHKYASTFKKSAVYGAMRKHGIDNFTFECIETLSESSTTDDLNNREIHWIKELNALSPNGYNLKEGGSHGHHSEETKLKMSETHKNKVLSEEHKRKLSIAHKGLSCSEEHRRKISVGQLGITKKPCSKETKLKISKAKTGKRTGSPSEETKAKLRAANKGKKLSEEHKAKISATLKGIKLNASS